MKASPLLCFKMVYDWFKIFVYSIAASSLAKNFQAKVHKPILVVLILKCVMLQ